MLQFGVLNCLHWCKDERQQRIVATSVPFYDPPRLHSHAPLLRFAKSSVVVECNNIINSTLIILLFTAPSCAKIASECDTVCDAILVASKINLSVAFLQSK